MEKDFSTRFGKAVKARGITFYRLAKRAGVSKSTVSNYATGKICNPDGTTLKKLCDELEVSPNWLLYGTGNMQLNETETAYICYRKHSTVSQHDKEHLMAIIKRTFEELDWQRERNDILEKFVRRNMGK